VFMLVVLVLEGHAPSLGAIGRCMICG
jgi:hypothetical protein